MSEEETLRFLLHGNRAEPSKRTTKPAKAPLQLMRPRVWVLNLLHQTDASVDDLNRQLVLPSAGGRRFVLYREPPPLTKLTRSDQTFEGPLLRGADPTGRYFGNEEDRFVLAERVEGHIPGSRAWLLESLAPYLNPDLPPIGVAIDTLQDVLSAAGMWRISDAAMTLGARHYRGAIDRLAVAQRAHFAHVTEAWHLPLLVALYHEACWQDPASIHTDQLRGAVDFAFTALMAHPMFALHPAGEIALDELRQAQRHILAKVRKDGHRSSLPTGLVAPNRRWPSIFCHTAPGVRDADYCASLRVSLPLSHLLSPQRTAFATGDFPSEAEALCAFQTMINHASLGGESLRAFGLAGRDEFAHFLRRF